MVRGRAFRRFQLELAKERAKSYYGGVYGGIYMLFPPWTPSELAKTLGLRARTPKRCSGPCCGNSRKWFGDVTWQEKKARSLKED